MWRPCKKKLKISKPTQNYLPKQVWGKLLTRLRENGDVALFVSCGEISDVKIEENCLIINTEKDYIYNLLVADENLLSIKRALRFLGIALDVKVQKIAPKDFDVNKDIEFLKEKFKNLVIE